MLGRAAKKARPRVAKLAKDAAPRLKEAAGRAVDFAGEHDQEIKQAATKLARSRLTGPAGLIIDALVSQQPAATTAVDNKCPHCGAPTTLAAKFCGECGKPLARRA